MSLRRAIREQLRLDRHATRLAGALLLSLLLTGLVLHEPWGVLLRRLLSPADLRLLLRWSLACLLLLIPIAGIISLVSQYAFWEGWLEGLPEPEELFGSPARAIEAGEMASGFGDTGPEGLGADADGPERQEATERRIGAVRVSLLTGAEGAPAIEAISRSDSPRRHEMRSGISSPNVLRQGDQAGRPAAIGTQSLQRRILIYLDGIHQLECDHPPSISAFLDALEARLPAGSALLRGLETYTVTAAALVEDSGGSWFWRRLFALQEQHPNGPVQALAAALVQANNVIKVGISSDRRYGPIRHYELALKLCWRLSATGFRPADPVELVLLGYSGGAEMAFGAADYLARICRVPVRIICFCGVFSGNHPLERLSGITTVEGGRDPVAAFGTIAYPGRMPLWPRSRWRWALASGMVRSLCIAGMNHNGSAGPFSPAFSPQVLEAIVAEL